VRHLPNERASASAGWAARARRGRWILLILALLTTLLALDRGVRSRTTAPIELAYRLRVADPQLGKLSITLDAEGLRASTVQLGFSPNAVANTAPVSKFRVRRASTLDGKALQVIRERGQWRIAGVRDRLRVEYDVYVHAARDGSQFADEVLSQLDAGGGRLLGSDVFLFPLGAETNEIPVRYELPDSWRLAHPFPGPERLAALYPDLPSAYGSVVAIGSYRTLQRRIDSCEIVVAIRGRFAFDDDDLLDVIGRIAAHQIDFFGVSPRPRYVFVVNAHPEAEDDRSLHYFGLHFDGSMIVLLDARTDWRRLRNEPAALCAHEFFHNWNGEILRQRGYELNWFIEGVTTYYAYRTLLATGMLDNGGYARELRRRFEEQYRDLELRGAMSVAEAGNVVLQDERVTRLLYSGGLFLALCLDQAIAEATNHRSGLDELMRRLVEYARSHGDFRLTRQTLAAELRELTGLDFEPWLDRYAYGVDPLPLPAYVTES
jgi:predicted metalloprotease with PDZ domain